MERADLLIAGVGNIEGGRELGILDQLPALVRTARALELGIDDAVVGQQQKLLDTRRGSDLFLGLRSRLPGAEPVEPRVIVRIALTATEPMHAHTKCLVVQTRS